MRKTSVYLDDEQADRLARLARAEGRPQAEIVREAIACYRPSPTRDRNFALGGNFERIDGDSRPISEIPGDELMRGFGEAARRAFLSDLAARLRRAASSADRGSGVRPS